MKIPYQTIVFTHANTPFYHFVSPFVYFLFSTNQDIAIEITIEDKNSFDRLHADEIEYIKKHFPNRTLLLRDYALDYSILPNTRRFVDQIQLQAEYIYISDIDIFVLDKNITEQHLNIMKTSGLAYSNTKRPGAQRLTGLHFSPFKNYYPLPNLDDLLLNEMNDEQVLFTIVSRKGYPISEGIRRPVHGIHTSLNRPPVVKGDSLPSWRFSQSYLQEMQLIFADTSFIEFEALVSPRIQIIFDKIRSLIRSKLTEESEAESKFTSIYKNNSWNPSISAPPEITRSGSESTWGATKLLRARLRKAFADLNIKTLVDAPCGDVYWFSALIDTLDLYIGIDIVEEIINRNIKDFSERNMSFRCADIATEYLPKVDAILCRDCLVHLPFEKALQALRRFSCSNSTYLFTTTFFKHEVNKDIPLGCWRPLNLTKAPFYLPEPFLLLNERIPGSGDHSDKSIGVWRIKELKSFFFQKRREHETCFH